jgi:hypothetical protein
MNLFYYKFIIFYTLDYIQRVISKDVIGLFKTIEANLEQSDLSNKILFSKY